MRSLCIVCLGLCLAGGALAQGNSPISADFRDAPVLSALEAVAQVAGLEFTPPEGFPSAKVTKAFVNESASNVATALARAAGYQAKVDGSTLKVAPSRVATALVAPRAGFAQGLLGGGGGGRGGMGGGGIGGGGLGGRGGMGGGIGGGGYGGGGMGGGMGGRGGMGGMGGGMGGMGGGYGGMGGYGTITEEDIKNAVYEFYEPLYLNLQYAPMVDDLIWLYGYGGGGGGGGYGGGGYGGGGGGYGGGNYGGGGGYGGGGNYGGGGYGGGGYGGGGRGGGGYGGGGRGGNYGGGGFGY